MSFIENLDKILTKKNITRYKLAKGIGVNPNTINNYATGTLPKIDIVIKICSFLGIESDELLGIKITEEKKESENEKEMLKFFKLLPEREQIKWIARIEDATELYLNQREKSSDTKIG